jgi:hypothetical protein
MPEPEDCENHNDPDLAQAFLKKWWVESDFILQEIVEDTKGVIKKNIHNNGVMKKGQPMIYKTLHSEPPERVDELNDNYKERNMLLLFHLSGITYSFAISGFNIKIGFL